VRSPRCLPAASAEVSISYGPAGPVDVGLGNGVRSRENRLRASASSPIGYHAVCDLVNKLEAGPAVVERLLMRSGLEADVSYAAGHPIGNVCVIRVLGH